MTKHNTRDCPFCLDDQIEDWGESTWSRPVKWMYCTNCQAQGPRVRLEYNEDETDWLNRAIDAWNDRPHAI